MIVESAESWQQLRRGNIVSEKEARRKRFAVYFHSMAARGGYGDCKKRKKRNLKIEPDCVRLVAFTPKPHAPEASADDSTGGG